MVRSSSSPTQCPMASACSFATDGRTNLLRNVLVDYVASLDSTTYDHRHRMNLDLHQLAAFPLAPNCRMNYLTGVDLLGES